ncbi:MAG: Ycf66 family protein, partial [Cyanobacteria bacterium J06555_13]
MFTSVSLLIGIILILGALALFFMDRLRPAYARESDKVYAILIFVAGIMTVPDVDMGLGHAFTLMILSGVATSIVIDNLRLRGPSNEEASPGNNRRDIRPPRPRYEERPPVRRGYRAELDNQGFDNRGPALR